jgi:aminopeptidase-like protein
MIMTGHEMHELAVQLFPICRSITGNGVRETLNIIRRHIPLVTHEVPSGTKVFDWTVPNEWNIRDAYILDEQGRKIVDFKENNLHVVGYSVPVDRVMGLPQLEKHLYSLETQPDAIPYVTSYYKERWGFCITHNKRIGLKQGEISSFYR